MAYPALTENFKESVGLPHSNKSKFATVSYELDGDAIDKMPVKQE